MKRHFAFLLIAFVLVGTAAPAAADACLEEIAALYDSGPLDPFSRPPHRQIVEQYDSEGTLTRTGLNIIETPLRTIAGEEAARHFTMAIDRELWNGEAPEGPWVNLGYKMPEGRTATLRRGMAEERANLTDTICHGETDDGLLHYTYRTQTDPDEGGGFYGALMQIWIAPDTNRIMRMEQTEFVNSWSEGISNDRHTIRFEYDETIRVDDPR